MNLRQITPNVVQQIHHNLVDFGYPNLTTEEIDRQIDLIQGGAHDIESGLDIIGLFTRGMLVENGFLDD